MEEEPVSVWQLKEEEIYVAVGRNVAKNMSSLIWALQKFEDNKICIIHVHQPPQMIPVMGTKFPASTVDEQIVRAYREKERVKTEEILDKYLHICRRNGVRAQKLYIEMDSIEEGIVQQVSQSGIRKLVMGAAADRHYSTRMTDLRSKKAVFVCQNAPRTCQIWFTCKGHLIHTREAILYEIKTISTLLSEFQQLHSLGKSVHSVQDVVSSGSLKGQSGRTSDGSSDTDKVEKDSRTGSFRTAGMLFSSEGSDSHKSEETGETESPPGLGVIKEKSNLSFSGDSEEAGSSRRDSSCCIC